MMGKGKDKDISPSSSAARIAREHAYFRQLFEHAPAGIVILDNEDKVVDVNPGFTRLFGYEPAEARGRELNTLIVPEEQWTEASEHSRRALAMTRSERFEKEAIRYRKDGHQVEVAVLATPILLDAEQLGIYAIYLDIGARRRAVRALVYAKEVAEVTLQAIGDAVLRTDAGGRVTYMNPVAERLTGWVLTEARGRRFDEVFVIINRQTRRPAPDPVRRSLREGRVVGLANHSVLISRDRREIAVEDSAAPVTNRAGRVIGVVLVFRDVTERQRLESELLHQAHHDALTGLFNRYTFEQRLNVLLRDRHRGLPCSLLYLDFDHFKHINDTCGHSAGDVLLHQLAARLRENLRESDLCARLGGDEFGVLLTDCNATAAMEVARKLIGKLIETPFLWQGRTFCLSASVGVVSLDERPMSLAQALVAADEACYAAKEAGGTRAYLYHRGRREIRKRESQMRWAEQLERALDADRLELYYQKIEPLRPVAPLRRGHCELLVRLRDENNRLVLPEHFISVAEHYGLIGRLDRWVCTHAFKTLAEWNEAARGPRPNLVDINISGMSIDDPEFLPFVRENLAQTTLEPRRICFELTETAAITNLNQTRAFIKQVHAWGGEIALDDFGSGMASFGYLRDLSVDWLKIDRSFVARLIIDPMHHAIVDAIYRVASSANILCVAEGIESTEVARALRAIGIKFGQGFALHRPERWIR